MTISFDNTKTHSRHVPWSMWSGYWSSLRQCPASWPVLDQKLQKIKLPLNHFEEMWKHKRWALIISFGWLSISSACLKLRSPSAYSLALPPIVSPVYNQPKQLVSFNFWPTILVKFWNKLFVSVSCSNIGGGVIFKWTGPFPVYNGSFDCQPWTWHDMLSGAVIFTPKAAQWRRDIRRENCLYHLNMWLGVHTAWVWGILCDEPESTSCEDIFHINLFMQVLDYF